MQAAYAGTQALLDEARAVEARAEAGVAKEHGAGSAGAAEQHAQGVAMNNAVAATYAAKKREDEKAAALLDALETEAAAALRDALETEAAAAAKWAAKAEAAALASQKQKRAVGPRYSAAS